MLMNQGPSNAWSILLWSDGPFKGFFVKKLMNLKQMNHPLGVLDCKNHGFIWSASWCVWDYPEDRPEILNVFRVRYTELRDRDDIPLLLEGKK